MRCSWCSVLFFVCCAGAHAQTLPPRWDDLPKLAAGWPPAWAALVQEARAARDCEAETLRRIDDLLKNAPTVEDHRRADIVLGAALRHSHSVRQGAPLADDPSRVLQQQLGDRLTAVRKDWLALLQKDGNAEALKLADAWLPTTSRESPLRTAIASLWTKQARDAMEKADYATARSWLNRAEADFEQLAPFEEIAKALRGRAEKLLKDAEAQPDTQAARTLEEALTLWPRLPGARDALERRRGTFRSLLVAVPALPEYCSPATATTDIERQTLDLLFDRLLRIEVSENRRGYRPQLAAALPTASASMDLRKDVYWSSGDRFTAADVRHTALLLHQPDAPGRSALWRDFLEIPRVEGGAFHVNIGQRQGLFDPLAPLTFWVLPQYYRGKQLQRGDDPEFAKAPVGSGPYQLVGRRVEDGRVFVAFHANPHDLRAPINLREVRMAVGTDLKKDFPAPPHMIIDAPLAQRAALAAAGYVHVPTPNTSRVHFLAVNHRKPLLTSVTVRRAMAHALDRQKLLDQHFRATPGKESTSAASMFPRGSWASAPAPRVPAELYQLEQARSFARQIKIAEPASVTLKYPTGDPRGKSACDDIAATLSALFKEAQIKIGVQAVGLSPQALRKALDERDFDMLYTAVEDLDDPVRLALFFDRQEDATKPGGSNILGYDSDVKLHEYVRNAVQHRQFSVLQVAMQAIDVHLYESMPAIPLWQLDAHVMVHPSLKTPPLDPRALFANVREWKIDK